MNKHIERASGIEARAKILDFIDEYISSNHGIPPTRREIQEAVGISSLSIVQWHLNVLEEQNKILWLKNRARGVIPITDNIDSN